MAPLRVVVYFTRLQSSMAYIADTLIRMQAVVDNVSNMLDQPKPALQLTDIKSAQSECAACMAAKPVYAMVAGWLQYLHQTHTAPN